MAFLSGGYLPAAVRGGAYSGLISVADWYGTLAALAGIAPHDPVAALPPVDSVVGLWDALMVPNGTSSPRTELLHNIDPVAPHPHGCPFGHAALRVGDFKLLVGSPGSSRSGRLAHCIVI